ncbi:MAG: aminotransferase class III-fold pyridoxal phosphate-dependent enzyme [archaeon]
MKRARDVYVEDPDGNVFVELISGRCVVNTGYNHPIVTRALREQIRDTIHGQTEEAYRLL